MKKLLILFCFIPFALNGQLINIGTSANDGTGDNLRTAFGKVNTEVDRIRTYLPNGATPTFPEGGWRLGSITVTASGLELNILDGALVNATELNYLVGTTSNVQTQLDAKAASSHSHAYEASLGNPAADGYILSSTAAGVRSWVAGGDDGSMVYPAAGIALSSGSGWSTSITNNSTNWNSAYAHSITSHQTIISGTGFVKATGTSLSYDNSSYSLTSHNHTGTYEPANANIQAHISSTHQTIVNGTGFVKATGTTLSYDNNTYATTAQATSAAQTVVSDSLDARLTAATSITSIVPMLVDTIPLATFGIGGGLAADTACFNNGALIGCFYNEGSDTLKVTQLMAVLKEGTGTETISVQISWHATMLSGSATNLNASALAVTSLTTGTVDASFANAKIPPNVFVWGVLSGASKDNKPTFLSVTLSGYKIPKY